METIKVLQDLLLPLYEKISPCQIIGPYTFRRKYLHLAYQGLLEYDLSGITKDSIVLDLGASVGGFTIQTAKRCKKVYAVEPLFTDVLHQNLMLNNIGNVTVLPFAIGNNYYWGTLEFNGKEKEVQFCTLESILKGIPKIDFMKCDILGIESFIDFDSLSIPNIEAEYHTDKGVYHYSRRGTEITKGDLIYY